MKCIYRETLDQDARLDLRLQVSLNGQTTGMQGGEMYEVCLSGDIRSR